MKIIFNKKLKKEIEELSEEVSNLSDELIDIKKSIFPTLYPDGRVIVVVKNNQPDIYFDRPTKEYYYEYLYNGKFCKINIFISSYSDIKYESEISVSNYMSTIILRNRDLVLSFLVNRTDNTCIRID